MTVLFVLISAFCRLKYRTVEEVLDFQKGFCSMELVSLFVSVNYITRSALQTVDHGNSIFSKMFHVVSFFLNIYVFRLLVFNCVIYLENSRLGSLKKLLGCIRKFKKIEGENSASRNVTVRGLD
jgi:hypothetical protein